MTPKAENDSSEKTNNEKKKKKKKIEADDEADKARLLMEDPLDLMLKNEHVSNMLSDVRDRDLPNKLISMVHEMNFKAGDADCILLLLCKLKPFVWSMQKAIDERIVGEKESSDDEKMNHQKSVDRLSIFFKFVPSVEEFKNNGMECEESHRTCKLF